MVWWTGPITIKTELKPLFFIYFILFFRHLFFLLISLEKSSFNLLLYQFK